MGTLITQGAQKFHSLIELLHEQLNIRLLQEKIFSSVTWEFFFRKVSWEIEYEHRSKSKDLCQNREDKDCVQTNDMKFFFFFEEEMIWSLMEGKIIEDSIYLDDERLPSSLPQGVRPNK